MKKVAFYLDNSSLSSVDFSNLLSGNPGIGGTEYQFLLVSYLLEQRSSNIIPTLITRCKTSAPHKSIYQVDNLFELCEYCSANGIKTIVMNQLVFDEKLFDNYKDIFDIVLWDHNGMNLKRLNVVNARKYVKRIVCCGREMMDMYRDHPATLKSTYIYNMQPIQPKEWYKERIDFSDNHNVVYMGSIIPTKGFHVLARSWKTVIKHIPDAQLYVIGSGKLYDKNAQLGMYGIAEASYEQQFMKYLIDENGKVLDSVHFLGLLGNEKYEVLGKCKVAVPNPTGDSECLPLTTMEMQLMGCGITTIFHQAYLDTVCNKQWLYHRCRQLASYIVERMNAPREDYDDLYSFVSLRFCVDNNLRRWEETLLSLNEPMQIEDCSSNSYQMKGLKDIILKVKCHIPLLSKIVLVRNVYRAWQHRVTKNNEW